MKMIALSLVLTGLGATAAAALPAVPSAAVDGAGPIAEHVASWRYHRNCGWRNGRWEVDLGAGKIVVCRPNRPGRSYVWSRDGGREGWYDRRRKHWHYDKW